MRLKVEGVENVVNALRNADKELQEALRDLVAEAAEIVFREVDSVVPIGQTQKVRESLRIEIGTNSKGIFYANVVVGHRADSFYVTFYELGSSRQPPRPFLRPSLDKCKTRIRKHLAEGLKKVLLEQGM